MGVTHSQLILLSQRAVVQKREAQVTGPLFFGSLVFPVVDFYQKDQSAIRVSSLLRVRPFFAIGDLRGLITQVARFPEISGKIGKAVTLRFMFEGC